VLSRTTTVKTESTVSYDLSSNMQDISRIDTDLLAEPLTFERHEESTAIELFYDLFFVANLTTFSNIHEITDVKTLTSYIGFFSILWFTWCLTSMYDIRFVSDSLLARIAKGVHLGVMVGLAFSGPKFDTTEHNPQLGVMGTTLSYLGRVLTAHVLISTDPNGLKICSWPSIPPSNLPCPRVQKNQTSPRLDRRLSIRCCPYLLGS
jgi:hypothetical protein